MGNFIDITQDLLVNISPRISAAVKTQLKKSNNKTNEELLLNILCGLIVLYFFF